MFAQEKFAVVWMFSFKRVFIAMLIALCALSFAYPVYGEVVYLGNADLSTAIVKAHSGGALVGQAVCNGSGYYSLELPAGNYTISAQYYDQKQKTMFSSSENLSVLADTKLDLPLFLEFEEMPNFTSPQFPDEGGFTDVAEQKPALDATQITIALALAAVVLTSAYFLFVRNKQEGEVGVAVEERLHGGKKFSEEAQETEEAGANEAKETPNARARPPKPEYDDVEKVMGMIMKQRQISQGDIIRVTNFSSAKVSLILKELERKKKIVREKIGRMKIIRARRVK